MVLPLLTASLGQPLRGMLSAEDVVYRVDGFTSLSGNKTPLSFDALRENTGCVRLKGGFHMPPVTPFLLNLVASLPYSPSHIEQE